MNESVLITGANIGLGKETARQLALRAETRRVILLCRNQAKAEAARKDLEEQTGRKIFELVLADVADANSVRKAAGEIKTPVDAVILNAGGVVGKTAAEKTPSGMNRLSATNILGHVVLVEELIKQDKLKKTVMFASAEAVPGVKLLGIKRVSMKTSSVDEFIAVLDGSHFGDRFDALQAYAYVKYAGTMWMLSMARRYPGLKFVVMSPGNTKGTQAPENLPPPVRFMVTYFMMPIVFPLIGEWCTRWRWAQNDLWMASPMRITRAASSTRARRGSCRGRWLTRARSLLI